MSPLARSLLALAAAALLHGACGDPQCTMVVEGSLGLWPGKVQKFHLDQTDSVIDLAIEDGCLGYGDEVGILVQACDSFGAAPQVKLIDDGQRARIICTWTDGQQCPEGIDVVTQSRCA